VVVSEGVLMHIRMLMALFSDRSACSSGDEK
jgi:hypothetical protein